MAQEQVETAYWKIRGLGAPLRMLLSHAGANYKDVTYEVVQKEDGSYDRSCWFSVKPALQAKNPLMNLPYVVDGDRVVTQSTSCLTYFGRKYKLSGANDDELTRVEQILAQAMDLRNDSVRLFYGPADKFQEGMVSKYWGNHYKKLEEWLNLYQFKFLCSNEVTTADFPVWEMLDQIELANKVVGKPSALDAFPKLKEYYLNFKNLETLKNYFSSEAYLNFPCNQKFASFAACVKDHQ